MSSILTWHIKSVMTRWKLDQATQLTEVLSSLGDYISAKLHDNTPSALSTNGDIEENLGVRPVRVKYRVSFYWHLYFIMYVSSISRWVHAMIWLTWHIYSILSRRSSARKYFSYDAWYMNMIGDRSLQCCIIWYLLFWILMYFSFWQYLW
jgi:hypothetical protein